MPKPCLISKLRATLSNRLSVRRTCLLFIALQSTLGASDWPAYRNDAERSSATNESFTLPLNAAWVFQSAQAPKPAWPEPGRAMNTLDFDYAFQPVVAGEIVYFGSSADDTVRAIDLATGKAIWSYSTGGPVRFAPQISEGRCYFASDDASCIALMLAAGRKSGNFAPRSTIGV